jgi:hypothetical protein
LTVPEESTAVIYHIFADVGIESEPLSAYGRVVRVGREPLDLNDSAPVKADARALPLKPVADLAVLHPPCQRWSTATSATGTTDDHPDHLDLAREIGREYADHYIIENVPNAPLREPVTLSGRMFGLPIVYRRSFETSFYVEQPPEYQDLTDCNGPFADHGKLGNWGGSADLWRTAKQVTGDYPARALKRSGIPAPYIHYLVQHWLKARESEQMEVPA